MYLVITKYPKLYHSLKNLIQDLTQLLKFTLLKFIKSDERLLREAR